MQPSTTPPSSHNHCAKELVGRLPWDLAFGCSGCPVSTKRAARACPRAAEPMGLIATGSSPPLPAFAVPHKRGRLLIPGARRLLKPGPDLVGAVRILPVERPAL